MEEVVVKEGLNQPENIKINAKKKRIWEIDFIRGLCVLLMVFDHIVFDMGLFGFAWGNAGMYNFSGYYWLHPAREIIRYAVIFLFFFISGISTSFSRSNFYRGLKVLIFAYAVTFFTSFVEIDIRFGVLHALGYTMLIYSLIDLVDKSIWTKAILGVAFIVAGLLIFYNTFDFWFPDSMQWLNNAIGMKEAGFSRDDYVPLLPWAGIFLTGSVCGRLLYRQRKSLLSKIETRFTVPVEFIGRHALIIYPVHQLVIFGIFCLISILGNLPLPF